MVCRPDRREPDVRADRVRGEARAGTHRLPTRVRPARVAARGRRDPASTARAVRVLTGRLPDVRRAVVGPGRGRRPGGARPRPPRAPPHPPARGARVRRARDAVPADDRPGDGERGRGHGVLPLPPPDGAERSRRRPGRFTLAVDDFHRANEERGALPTAPAGDADARHEAVRRRAGTDRGDRDVRRRVDRAQAVVAGARRPARGRAALADARRHLADRAPAPRELPGKGLREAKRNTNWIEPDLEHERRVKEAARRAIESPPDGFEAFADRVAARGGGSRSG